MPTLIKPTTPNVVPNGSWTYVDPDSGESYTHPYLIHVKAWAKKHRLANHYPIGINWDHEFDANICKNSHGAECRDYNPDLIEFGTTLTLEDIIRGTSVIASVLTSRIMAAIGIGDGPLVDQGEADRRAEICASCFQFNVPYAKPCSGICDALKAIVQTIKGSRSTPKDDKLFACRICKCDNSTQIWVKKSILRKTVTSEMDAVWPSFCWKKPDETP